MPVVGDRYLCTRQALDCRGITVLAAHKGYTRTHQIILDVRRYGGGLEVAGRLARANIITNKNLIPADRPEDWDRPSGLRIGTTEVTRLGMDGADIKVIADLHYRILIESVTPERVADDIVDFRRGFQTLYFCFDNPAPKRS
jgi:glycine hydroxymethyltransferase